MYYNAELLEYVQSSLENVLPQSHIRILRFTVEMSILFFGRKFSRLKVYVCFFNRSPYVDFLSALFQCVPYLISMGSDTDPNIRVKADQQLAEIDKKYPGFIQVGRQT